MFLVVASAFVNYFVVRHTNDLQSMFFCILLHTYFVNLQNIKIDVANLMVRLRKRYAEYTYPAY